MVLLKNNGILPLRDPRRIAVIGRGATAPHFQGGGSSHVEAIRVDVPLEELRRQAGDGEVTYAEGYPADGSFQQALIDEAVAAARAADVALLYIALPEDSESEGYDRTGIDLSPQQVALIQAVGRAQPATAVILNNGAPVAMSAWIDDVAAVLEAWLMGQAGGGAIADILFGKANPSGKLAESFPLKLADNPATVNWPGNREVRYGEGIFTGYRYYDAKEMDVLFPFGYGLSYTTFAYSHPRVSASSFRDVNGVTVSVDVTNTGSVAGKEIVQVYVHDRQSDLARPPKELKGFAKVELRPGETKTVSIPLDFRAFAYYHPRYAQWITEDGDFDLLIGASSRDIRCQLSVTLQSTVRLPSLLDQGSTLREWMGDPNGRRVLEPLMQQALAQMTGADGGMGMNPQDLLAMAMDMPLSSLLNMVPAGLLPVPPDDLINGLLAQARAMDS
jgi:beta-glucosidase